MSVQQFTTADRTVINWAGGTSTQLFIHPSNASFAARDFLFRISTATVELETSTFTLLEGVTRHLMILEGKLELIHTGHYTKHLEQYDQDTFPGSWHTHSKGKVTDFNLMLRNGATGALKHHRLKPRDSISFNATTPFYFIYFAQGCATFNNGDLATTGGLLQLMHRSDLIINALELCDLITIEIQTP